MPQKPAILITAGPTHEPIDAVRYLANRSSGTLGIAIAEASVRRACPTTLLLGPTPLTPDPEFQIDIRRFTTTSDLETSLQLHAPAADLIIMLAAVADFRPAHPPRLDKLPREEQSLSLTLERTPDLIAALAINRPRVDQKIVAFALEPAEHLVERATAKLARKGVDAIVANPLETMDAPTISAHLIFPGTAPLAAPENLPKAEFAEWLLDQLL